MRLICKRPQLYSTEYGLVVDGQEFDCPHHIAVELLRDGHVRKPEAPRVLYETKVVIPEAPAVAPRLPFVTCLCLTRNRRQWLPQAIRCYQAQAYPHRELLIVSDGPDVGDLIPQDDSIRLIHVDGAPLIGDKRNFACSQARGEIIAHWDDDDTSSPGRLADQVERLAATGKAVTGYASMYFLEPATGEWWRYAGKTASYGLGTSLCYRRDWWEQHQFPHLQIGEDNDFVGMAHRAGQYAGSERDDMMYATIHPGNTSPRNRASSWRHVRGFSWEAA